ncbi:MAG: hypothetical protein R6U50_04520 [Desulfobacterales bacterium]
MMKREKRNLNMVASMAIILGVVLAVCIPETAALNDDWTQQVTEMALAGNVEGIADLAAEFPESIMEILNVALKSLNTDDDGCAALAGTLAGIVPDKAEEIAAAVAGAGACAGAEEQVYRAVTGSLRQSAAGVSAPGDPALRDGTPPTVEGAYTQ